MNNIADSQNTPYFLRLLRARSQIYHQAVQLQWAQIVLTIVCPVASAIVGIIWEVTRPYVASATIVITVIDVLWLDRAQRRKLKAAAKVSEQFDCELLKMPWNAFIAGKKLSPEAIEAAAVAWRKGDSKLVNWYPPHAAQLDLPLARIMCQRANLWYDSALRRTYSTVLIASSATVAMALFSAGLAMKLSLVDFTATILTPAAPMLIWSIRDCFRQKDAADAVDAILSEAEALKNKATMEELEESSYIERARAFQDAIYNRRSANPLIFPFIYKYYRPKMENQMYAGANDFVRQFKEKS